jgi:pyridoxamine 5'-phosphate oxidase
MTRPDGLNETEFRADPIEQFRLWFADARTALQDEALEAALATATADGAPAARFVLIRGVEARGFVFYTNAESRKGLELAANPRAALVFHWRPLHRQVRIEGIVERVSEAESDTYFATRARDSQISAAASPQSRVIESRDALEERVRALEARFAGGPVPRPPQWGGFRVRPDRMEFWQGRLHRLHDRLDYVRTGGRWQRRRLAP